MPILQSPQHQSQPRRILHVVPGVLRPSGCVGAALPCVARGTARGNRAASVQAADQAVWPGRDFGVRQPYPKETPLSLDEVHFAKARGLI